MSIGVPPHPTVPGTKPAFSVRRRILAMLFAITVLNSADRATLSFAGPSLQQALGISTIQMGYVFSAFAWSYVVAQLPGGWLVDRFGTKLTGFFSIFLRSLFTLTLGFVGFLSGGAAVAMLFVCRLLVGAAEAPSFPGYSRLISAWFPSNERGLAFSIFGAAQSFATVVFIPLIAWLVLHFGGHSAFFVMGALGLLLAFAWQKAVYGPKNHPRISRDEFEFVKAGGALVDLEDLASQAPPQVRTWACIKELLSNRMLVGVYFGQYCIATTGYFFLTWFPVYLVQERGMSILQAGFAVALPAVAGFAGGLLGGWLSDRLLQAGHSLSLARKLPIVLGMVMSMSMVACNVIQSDVMVVTVMALAFFGKGLGSLGWVVVSDTSPKEAGGLSGGLFNTFGNIAGITTPIIIGYIVHGTGSFAGALVFVGANAAMAIVSFLFIAGDIHRVTLTRSLTRV